MKQRPDIIVLDLMMPVMDGYGVLAELAKDPRTASVPVVVLSAKAIPDEADRASAAGARGSWRSRSIPMSSRSSWRNSSSRAELRDELLRVVVTDDHDDRHARRHARESSGPGA